LILYFGSNDGVKKIYTGNDTLGNVPDLNSNNPDLLLSIPLGGTSSGNYVVDSSLLYSSIQPLYLLFSKDMADGATSGASIESFITVKNGIDGSGATVNGSWLWDSSGRLATFTPTVEFSKATAYNLSIAMGGVSDVDNTPLSTGLNVGFYTENIEPVLGWQPLGKIMMLSGTDAISTQNIYLRNTNSTGVNVIGLIGK
jgi:hypothetical protein